MVLFLVVQQGFGGYLIAAIAVVGAETRQLRKEQEKRVGVLPSMELQLTSLAGTEQSLTPGLAHIPLSAKTEGHRPMESSR